MSKKYDVNKVILYDVIANNLFIIFATLHHIIIILFNYSSIQHLNTLMIDFPEQHNRFEAIQFNLHVCQSITLLTAIVIQFIIDKTEDNLRITFVMFSSCFIKISYTFIQICNFDRKTIENNVNYDFGIYYRIIEVSYITRFIFMGITFLSLILALTTPISIKVFEKSFKYVKARAKQYKNTYADPSKFRDV
jgi:hypothetical protein